MENDKLRLDLQFFSSEVDDEPIEPNADATDEVDNGVEDDRESVKDEKKFTQAELDRLIADRLERDRKKREEDAERKRLEEQGEYKALLDKANETIAELQAEKAKVVREKTINDGLLAKGLSVDEVAKYAKYVNATATSDEEIANAIETVYSDFVALKQSAIKEPSAGFGSGKESEQKGDDDFGRELFKRLGR